MERNASSTAGKLIISLEGDVELRSATIDDADELFGAIDRNRSRLNRWLPWAGTDYSIEDTRQFLSDRIAELAEQESLTMMIRCQGFLCGAIGLHRIDARNRSTSIGYWIDEAYEGRGIITAACKAVVTEGFHNFGLHRIEIRCATRNHRSSAVPKRLGFVEEGILRETERLSDGWVDQRVFSMLAHEWKM